MRELEARLPLLQQNACLQNGGAHAGQSGQNPHSLVGRVDALEEAVEVLLIAQVSSTTSRYKVMVHLHIDSTCRQK